MKRSWIDRTGAGGTGSQAFCGLLLLLLLLAWLVASPVPALAQEIPVSTPTPSSEEQPIEAPESVDVQPEARDEEIRARLQGILEATGWFVSPQVRVDEGVVFLQGG